MKKNKNNRKPNRHPLADLYQRVSEIDSDLEALKPYEYGYPEVRENRQQLRNERSDVVATIKALEKRN